MLYLIALAPGVALALFLLGVSAVAALMAKLIDVVCHFMSKLFSKDA